MVRSALEATPDSYMIGTFPAGADADSVAEVPAGLADLLQVTNGPRAGVLAVFAAEALPDNQFYCDDLHLLEGGRSRWFCFAVGLGFPLMIERDTGAVWWFPDLEAEDYFTAERFERLTDSVEDFVDGFLLGAGYRRFSPSEDDWWYQFLRDRQLA
jgi:hypothetical protein